MSEEVFPTDAMDNLPLWTKNTKVLATPVGAYFSQAEAGRIVTEPGWLQRMNRWHESAPLHQTLP